MKGPTIIGKPAILVVDDNREWVERLEFSLGDQYRVVTTTDLKAADRIVKEQGPGVMLLDWEIARRDPQRARSGFTAADGNALPVILTTGFERPEVRNIAELIGGCIAIVERMDTLEELRREIAKVFACSAGGGRRMRAGGS
ncbi:MAG TPA: response regulator [Blastocatellia bacterium]|nr:response regulator [Blastocatellia bacterium]